MIRILFVCLGNICRSPMAEFLFREKISQRGLQQQYVCASAATSSYELGNGVYPPVARLLRSRGIECGEKHARQMTRSDYDRYDWLIGMETDNILDMKRICGGDPKGKIRRLLDFSSHPADIDDPYYTRDFDKAARDIEMGCTALLETLEGIRQKENGK